MKRAVHLFVAVLLVSIQAVAAVHATNYAGGNLSDWLVDDAAPALSKTLTQHPRFRNESIVLVDLDDQQLAHSSDGLTLAVLDSLHSSLLQTPGLLISRATGPENCASRIRSGYFLVVQATPVSRNDAKVEIRIFDVVEQQWVSGFGQQWRGRLSKAQWTAMAQQVVPDNALGERIAPFADDQSDLLAARLAAELACQLRHRGDDEITVQPARYQSAGLIAGNLAGDHSIAVDTQGELLLETRVHAVDSGLYQVWAILSPKVASSDIDALTASAYASSPLLKPKSEQKKELITKPVVQRASVVVPAAKKTVASDRLLSTLRFASDTGHCDARKIGRKQPEPYAGSYAIDRGACFGLQFRRQTRTHFYLFSQSADGGLLRLYPTGCDRQRPDFSATAISYPLQGQAFAWSPLGGQQSLHVIVTATDSATRRLDRLMSLLPDSCARSSDLIKDRNISSKAWLSSLETSIDQMGSDVAWQSLDVLHASNFRGARR